MAATGYTPIQLYYSTTASTAPLASNLLSGELAINILDEKLYFKNSSGTVKVLASTASTAGLTIGTTTVTSGTSGYILYNNAGTLGNLATTGSGSVTLATSPTITSPTFATSILGDFTNATVSSRTNFQTTTTNSTTGIYALPSGTGTAASWQATNNSDPTNASKILIATNGSTDVQLVSGINGTGTYLPLSLWNGGAGRFVIGTSGQFGIGPTASVSYGTSGQVLTSGGASAAPTWTTPSAGLTIGSTTITSGTSGYILYNNAGTLGNLANTGTGNNVLATLPTFGGTGINFSGSTSGTTTLLATAVAGTTTLTLPAATDTLVGKATTDTLTNKTISGASNTITNVSLTSGVTGTLPIANGGTNNGSLAVTAGGVVYTDGSKLVNVGAGTSGQVLTSAGASAPTWAAASGGGAGFTQIAIAQYTQAQNLVSSGTPLVWNSNGSLTFTIPSGVTALECWVIGGGGGGGGCAAGGFGAGQGGGGGVGGANYKLLTGLTAGNTLTITIGAAGTASAAGNSAGGSGGTSSISSGTQTITTISATGGGGGGGAANGNGTGTQGASGSESNYTALLYNNLAQSGNGGSQASGGIPSFGNNLRNYTYSGVLMAGGNGTGQPGCSNGNGTAATGIGAGGGGGYSGTASGNRSGGAGFTGIVTLKW